MPKSLLMSIYWVYLIIPCSAFVIYYLFELHSNRFHKLCIDHGEAFIKWRVKSHHESDPIIIEVVVRANMSIAEHVGNWRHRVGDSVRHWYLHNPNYGDVLIFGVDSGVSFIYYDNGQMNTVVGHTLFKENVIRKDNAAAYAKALTYNNTYVKSNDLFAAVFTDNYQSQIANLKAEIAELERQIPPVTEDNSGVDQEFANTVETPTDTSPDKNQVEAFVVHDGSYIAIGSKLWRDLYFGASPNTQYSIVKEPQYGSMRIVATVEDEITS